MKKKAPAARGKSESKRPHGLPSPRATSGSWRPATREAAATRPVRHGVARILSKSGVCSRSEAARWVAAGRVEVDGRVVTDPDHPVVSGKSVVHVDGQRLGQVQHRYLMLNKPRGLVTTTTDEKGRDTVYRCLDGADLPWVAPVDRLDKASEGLLLFSSDPAWAAGITGHEGGLTKTYHVQVDGLADARVLASLESGLVHDGQHLKAVSAGLLRQGERNCWLEVVLDEGRNRHIRRLMEAHGLNVLRLVRVAIGQVALGGLAKGQWRDLSVEEIRQLTRNG